jgi:dephospho-CoA kinase
MDSKKRPPQKKPRSNNNVLVKKFPAPTAGSLIAITGGIGTGKTTVLQCFERLGYEVFNADKVVHALMAKTGEAFQMVAKLFPQAVTDEGIDRLKVGEEVVKNPTKLKELEAILHPMVREKLKSRRCLKCLCFLKTTAKASLTT